jgi:hypothetical protein
LRLAFRLPLPTVFRLLGVRAIRTAVAVSIAEIFLRRNDPRIQGDENQHPAKAAYGKIYSNPRPEKQDSSSNHDDSPSAQAWELTESIAQATIDCCADTRPRARRN